MTSIDVGYAYARSVRHSQRPAPDLGVEPPEWAERALCAQILDDEVFFPRKGGSNRDGKRVCEQCPVRAECLAFAMIAEGGMCVAYRFGTYGGLSPRERDRLAKTGWQPGDPTPDVHIRPPVVFCPDCGRGTASLAAHRAKAHGIRGAA